MPLHIRRIIFIIFVCVFVISASSIIFYGSGYRWNSAKNKIEKTGQLSLDSKPKGAEVYVDGEPLFGTWKKIVGSSIETTPVNIKNLLPGSYNIEIKKDGYYPWKRNVRVISGQTSLFHSIRLLKHEVPEQIIAGDVLQFSIVSDTSIVALTKKDFFLYDTRQKIARSLFHSEKNTFISFIASPNGNQFFLRAQNMQWIITASGEKVELTKNGGDIFLNVRWSQNDELFGKTKDGIMRISLAPLVFKKIADGAVDDFFIHDEKLFTIEGDEKKSANMRELKQLQSPPVTILPVSYGGVFLDEPSYDIVIQKKAGGITILSPTGGKNAFNILDLDSISQVSEKKDEVFLGWNDVELWKYTLSGREYGKTLITRQGASLQKAFLSRIVPAVFFLSNNTVTMVDMSDSDNGGQMEMFRWDHISDIALSQNEKEFFISGLLNGAGGLYHLQIID